MCGIFGIISQNKVNTDRLNAVSRTIKHRGPDDEGFLLFNNELKVAKQFRGYDTIKEILYPHIELSDNFNSAFLHRRLSIIDLSPAGHQPMSYNNENYWIVFNGEIYNYLELRSELETNNFIFKTNSDTEVILAAYQYWGFDCVNKFNGMWAFAIQDFRRNQLFISRDRFGIKPLHYYFKNGNFIFCSEIKGIKSYLDKKLDINQNSIYKFLTKGEFTIGDDEQTMFNDVKQLMPGTNLIFKDNKITIEKYWELNFNLNFNLFDENVKIFKNLFYDSIKLRLRSDVEVGSCLSGGIDSSAIVSFASSKFNKQFHTFSAIWPGENCNESFYVDKVNKKYNCLENAFTPKLDLLDEVFTKEIWHQEMPIAGSSLLAQWFVMEQANKKGIKVLLDGQGADEVLGGYPRYIRTYLNEMIKKNKWIELIKYYPELKKQNLSLRKILGINRKLFIKDEHTPSVPLNNDFSSEYEKYEHNRKSYNDLNDNLISEIEKTCLPGLLYIEDRNSMAHSIEARVPYLDYRLVEFALSIPAEQKINGGLTKVVLREAMKDYLPPEVYNRRDKIGFSTPLEEKLFNENGVSFISNDESVAQLKLIENYVDVKNIKTSNQRFKAFSLSKFLILWN